MLILLTLLAISAFQASNVNLRIAGNMQVRQETLTAAQTATEAVLSTPAFTDLTTPPAAAAVNLNGANYTVNFTPPPACKSIVDIPSEDLVPTNPDDFVCIPSGALPGASSGIFVAGGRRRRPRTARTRAGPWSPTWPTRTPAPERRSSRASPCACRKPMR